MAEAYVFLADGFEEVEALTPVDLLRRAGVEVATISVNGSNIVTGAHGVPVVADEIFEEASGLADALMLVCPGGMPGASNLAAHPGLCDLLAKQHAAHRYVAAICAAPAVTLAPLGHPLCPRTRGGAQRPADSSRRGCRHPALMSRKVNISLLGSVIQ